MRQGAVVIMIALTSLVESFAAGPPPKAAFYVATNGSDRNPGTKGKPFATLTRARDAVRQRISIGLKANVTVLIRGGRYELTEPLTFGPEDSGTEGHSVTYAAWPGEPVAVSGSRKITGWRKVEGEFWAAEVPSARGGGWYFRQLYVKGQRATRARMPNASDSSGARDDEPACFPLTGAELSQDAQTYTLKFAPGQLKSCQNVSDVEAVILGEWEIMRKRLQSVDEAGGIAVLARPHVPLNAHPWNRPGPSKGCYLENALEFLDRPGEWYLDRRTGVVTYWPLKGQDMTRADAVAPMLTRLLEVAGTPERPVRNLHFRGLHFEHATWPLPEGGYEGVQACHYQSAGSDAKNWGWGIIEPALRWEWAQSCSLEDGEIAHLGGVGLFLGNGCSNNVVAGNHIFDIGGNGVMIGGPSKPSPEVPKGNRIANNHIHGCGVDYLGAVGIWVGFTDGTAIAHNVLHDLPYSGISVGWQWNPDPTSCKSNAIEYNHIYDVMKKLSDGGGIYTLGFQPGTVLRGNLIHDIRRTGTAVGAPNNGMFIDEGSKGFLIERNVIYATSGAPVRHNQNQAEWHTWVDNRFGIALPAEGKIGAGLLCDGASTFLDVPHAPVLEPKQMTIEAWVYVAEYPSGPDTRRWIVNKNDDEWTNGHYALVVNNKDVGAYLNIGGGQQNCFGAWSTTGPLTLNQWHHLAMSYDGSILRVYCGGEPVGATAVNRDRVPGNMSLNIGRRQDAYNYFKGVIDEVRLYDCALSEAELKKRFKAPEAEGGWGLVGTWRFEDLADVLKAIKEIQGQAGLEPPYRERLLRKP